MIVLRIEKLVQDSFEFRINISALKRSEVDVQRFNSVILEQVEIVTLNKTSDRITFVAPEYSSSLSAKVMPQIGFEEKKSRSSRVFLF